MTRVEQAQSLRDEVARHNAAIRVHRKKRRAAQAALRDIEATCRRLGIALTLAPQHSTGKELSNGGTAA